MKKITLLFFAVFCMSMTSYSQISVPQLRKFNVGCFFGLFGEMGPTLNTSIALNASYRGTTLTGVLGVLNQGYTLGIIQEIVPISVAHSNVRWIVSGFYSAGKADRYLTKDSDDQNIALLTGFRIYFGKHFFSNVQVGVAYDKQKTPGYDNLVQWLPTLECGLGFKLFKSFEPLKKKGE